MQKMTTTTLSAHLRLILSANQGMKKQPRNAPSSSIAVMKPVQKPPIRSQLSMIEFAAPPPRTSFQLWILIQKLIHDVDDGNDTLVITE